MLRIRTPLATILTAAALCAGFWGSAGPASAAGFKRCETSAQLKSKGIIKLRASQATCTVARQVASGFTKNDDNPKGFTCMAGVGGNRIPYTCVRTASVIKFVLEA